MIKLRSIVSALVLVAFSLFAGSALACDDATFTFNSETDNGDGTFTYSVEICAEMLGLEGIPDWFQLEFSGGSFTGINSFAATTVSTSGGDDYDGSLFNANAAVRWELQGIFPAHNSALFCNTFTITTNGKPTTIDINFHDTYSSSDCYETFVIPVTPSCSIDNLTATPSGCNAADNTYTVDVVVTYSNPPASGNLEVNGQTFPITTSPQTVTLTGLTADGAAVNVSAEFTANSGCTLTNNALYMAPAACSACAANAGTISR